MKKLPDTFTCKILNWVIDDRIIAYDTLFNRIPPILLEQEFYKNDTTTSCAGGLTRPRFVDNIYHDFIDGAIWKRDCMWGFDTLTFLKNENYIVLWHPRYDIRTGDFLGDKIDFLIKKNAIPITLSTAKKRFRNSIQNPNSNNVKNLITNKKEKWVLKKESDNELDSCEKLYWLRLKPNFEFEQYYNKDTVCYSAWMHPEIHTGAEDDGPNADYYNVLQYYIIEHPRGLWQIKDNILMYHNDFGRLLLSFEIVSSSKNALTLKYNTQTISLIKVNSE